MFAFQECWSRCWLWPSWSPGSASRSSTTKDTTGRPTTSAITWNSSSSVSLCWSSQCPKDCHLLSPFRWLTRSRYGAHVNRNKYYTIFVLIRDLKFTTLICLNKFFHFVSENDGWQQLGSSLGRVRDDGQRHDHLFRQDRNPHHQQDDRCSGETFISIFWEFY